MSQNYFTERDERSTEKARQIISELPPFVREFFVGIQMKTSALTRLNYTYDLRVFFEYLSAKIFSRPVKEITLGDLESLVALDLEVYLEYLTSYTINGKKYRCGEHAKQRKLAALRTFFKYYFKKDKLGSDISAKVDMPKVHEKAITRLEPHEIALLLDKIDSEHIAELNARQNMYHDKTKIRDAAIVTLFLGTGIRISELVGLNVEDMDFSSNSFRVTRKGGNQSILYFSDEIAAALKKYMDYLQDEIDNKTAFGLKIDSGHALFLSLQGTRITVRAVQDTVKKYAKLVTPLKRITPHKLRSTFGTELYRNTQDIYVVADVLGHKDVNTTKKHYAAISEEIRRNASRTVKLRDND